MKYNTKEIALDFGFIAVGIILYSISINTFLVPAGILPGGLTGIAAAVAEVTKLYKGAIFFVFNIPIIYMGFKKIGSGFIIKTAVVTALLSAALDLLNFKSLIFHGEKMLSALAGGVLLGAGIGLIMLRGATTGGTDIIAKLVNRKHPSLTVGRVILLFDIISIGLSGIVFGDISNVLYSLIAVYTAARVTDLMVYGSGGGKTVFVITDKGEEISKAVFERAQRGVTLLPAKGGYTGRDKTMLCCACRRDDINKVVSAVRDTDMFAFITVFDAGEIIGEGFKR